MEVKVFENGEIIVVDGETIWYGHRLESIPHYSWEKIYPSLTNEAVKCMEAKHGN